MHKRSLARPCCSLARAGAHAVDIRVGYYTSVVGLGRSPADVEIRNVICENGDFDFAGGALSNFWRSAENFKTKPTLVFNSEVRALHGTRGGEAPVLHCV